MHHDTYSVQQVADRYGVSLHTVLAWIHRGELRAVNVSRKPGAKRPSWRITAGALGQFELARTPGPPAPARRRRRHPDVIAFY